MATTPSTPAVRVEADYPRYSSAASRHYPELLPGGRQQASAAHVPSASMPMPPPMRSAAQPAPPYPPTPYPPFSTPSPMGGPMPVAWSARPRSWQLLLTGVGAACGLVGFLLGMAVFRGDADGSGDRGGGAPPPHDAAPVTTPAPATAPDAGPARAVVPPDGGPASPAGQVIARASSVTHPPLVSLASPIEGEVARVHAADGAPVKRGAKLFTLRPSDKKTKKQDVEVVTAPRAGLFAPALAKGDTVDDGAVLGALLDPARWWITFDLPGVAATLSWSCEVASGDGTSHATCAIERVERLAGSTRATAAIRAEAAAWLEKSPADAVVTVAPPR
jgi:hypothetical protein